jgi:hypothetical protein
MAIYIGFYRPNADYARDIAQRVRRGELTARPGQHPDPQFAQKVRELPAQLPPGCTLVASYSRAAYGSIDGTEDGQLPGVMIVETNTATDLAVITNYYLGYLTFTWHPYTAVPRA